MPTAVGSAAPSFSLADAGGTSISLDSLLAGGPVLLAFFKTNCPTCRLSFPVWGELGRRYGDAVQVVGVAQDRARDARRWLDELGFEGPVLDDSDGYGVSAAFGLDTVPTLVLVDEDGRVAAASEGWDRDEANAWDERLARASGRDSPGPVSTPEDGRPPRKPG